tara:strand:- start:8872 stop:9609 length:738 start_codon:yes stop_codon:yes gene_type:complete
MLLQESDPRPALIGGPAAGSGLVLTCEHAGTAIPRSLGDLGVAGPDLQDHIGWDPGALDLTLALSARLAAPFAAQPYSRLVIDCNRPRDAADLAAERADDRPIPGNAGLSASDLDARWDEIHQPFHRELAALLPGKTALASIHSFTPRRRVDSELRPLQIGVLARDDNALFRHIMRRLPTLHDGPVAANAPYEIEDASDYTIPVHAEARGLPHVLIEVRNDLIGFPAGVCRIADTLAIILKEFSA